jgi:dolichyl-phosphate beta-glucosyltransferase
MAFVFLITMKLSIIIPAYNEEKRIESTLEKVVAYLKKQKLDWEILVINDGSTDKTKEVVLSLKDKKIRIVDNVNDSGIVSNKGKGYSVKQGLLEATGDWILFSDADLSTPIKELETLLRYSHDYPVVIGSRNLPMSKIVVKQPLLRSTLGKIFPFLVRTFLLDGVQDSQCGFKLFRADVAKKVCRLQRLDGFAFDAELLFLARKCGFAIKEVPVTWANDERSKVSIFRDSFSMFIDLFRVRWLSFTGVYRNGSSSNKLNKR